MYDNQDDDIIVKLMEFKASDLRFCIGAQVNVAGNVTNFSEDGVPVLTVISASKEEIREGYSDDYEISQEEYLTRRFKLLGQVVDENTSGVGRIETFHLDPATLEQLKESLKNIQRGGYLNDPGAEDSVPDDLSTAAEVSAGYDLVGGKIALIVKNEEGERFAFEFQRGSEQAMHMIISFIGGMLTPEDTKRIMLEIIRSGVGVSPEQTFAADALRGLNGEN